MASPAARGDGPRRNPPRLNIINPSISYTQQQAQALFSPALPTAIHTGVGGGFPLQTPMQSFFPGQGQPPPAPGRPRHGQNRASISHFPGGQSIVTPVATHFPRNSIMLGNGVPPSPFTVGPGGPGQPVGPITLNNGPPPPGHRPHRRQMSIGGPPKAVLGGPQRKVSPNPAVAAATANLLKKKFNVNLPKETEAVDGEGDDAGDAEKQAEEQTQEQAATSKNRVSKEWARVPISVAEGEARMSSYAPLSDDELVSREPFPPEEWRKGLPLSIDVFLPGKATWDTLKQQVIEAKLEKLGVERGSGSNNPHIYAPHARAASISSPADPALLLFKLNKLQQAQTAQSLSPSIANSNSLAPSPQPPVGLSPPPQNRRPSPSTIGPNGLNRHAHTMSLARTPFNPFGPLADFGDDLARPLSTVSDSGVAGSSPLVEAATSSLSVPTLSRPTSRPDFVRGFGLDIPEEADEEAELDEQERREHEMRWKNRQGNDDEDDQSEVDRETDNGHAGDTEEDDYTRETGEDGEEDMDLDNETEGPRSRLHSRHVSKLSAALSLRSVGGNLSALHDSRDEGDSTEMGAGDDSLMGRESSPPPPGKRRPPLPTLFGHVPRPSISANREDLEDAIAVQEWTGSEEDDGVSQTDETSDGDQSLGEYSNPSDEERARRQRVERRMERRAEKEDAKRRKLLLKQRRAEAKQRKDQDTELAGGQANGGELIVDQPRRIPNFPLPPDSGVPFLPNQRDHYPQFHPSAYPQDENQDRDEIISNPSEENLLMGRHEYRYPVPVGGQAPYPHHPSHHHPYQQPPQFLGITPSASQLEFFNGVPVSPSGARSPMALPTMNSHSRDPSEGLSYTSHGQHRGQGSFGQHASSYGPGSQYAHVAPPPMPVPHYNHQHGNSFGHHSSSSYGQAPPPFPVAAPAPPAPPSAGNSSARRDSLNPFAKPFVFGTPLSAKAEPWQPGGPTSASPATAAALAASSTPTSAASASSHSRVPSLGKPLNIAAPEFKPRSGTLPPDAEFTFSMPTAAPGFPVPETEPPLAVLAAASVEREKDLYVDGSPIKKQGREKRPRLGSKRDSRDEDEQEVEFIENEIAAEAAEEHEVDMEEEEVEADVSRVEEGDSMVSFRFPAGPAVVSPKMIRKAHSHQPQAMVSSLAVGIPMSTSVSMDGRAEDVDAGDEFGSERDMDEVDSEEEDKENRRDTPVPVSASASMMMSKSFQQTESDSLGNDTQETTRSPAKQSQDVSVVTNESEFDDDDENVQELIIPPTLPNTNLSATFPTSATTKTSFGTVNLSPITAGGKPRRAPIPLDFKHPTATAPAGLFKALVQNVVAQNNAAKEAASGAPSPALSDDRTRAAVRSRMSSREIFEMHHMSRPSMDDMNVAKISGTGISSSRSTANATAANRSIHLPNFTGTVANRGRNVTEPAPSLSRDENDDVFGARNANTNGKGIHRRRRSSLPDQLRDESASENERTEDFDSDEENRHGNSSLNANPSHTLHISNSGRRILRSLPISRSQSSEEESSRMQLMRNGGLSPSASGARPRDLTSRLELHALFEEVLTRVLDERLAEFKRELNTAPTNGAASSAPEAMLSEVICLFRAQLQDSAAKSLEDTTMEARGEMDMLLIKDMLEDSQREVVGVVKNVVDEHLRQALTAVREAGESRRSSDAIVGELRAVVENAATRTVHAIIESARARQDAPATTQQHEILLDEMVVTLTPLLQGLRAEPIDYDFLTTQLAQAVKPHISQLIDLASDKRETAGLIIDALVPTLVNSLVPSLVPTLTPTLISNLAPRLVDTLVESMRVESEETRLGMVREVRKAVEGVDAIEIRERVADLVVERLDARLDARDKSFINAVNSSVTNVVEKVSERLDSEANAGKQQGLSEDDLKGVEQRVVQGVKEAVANTNQIPEILQDLFGKLDDEKRASDARALESEARSQETNVKVLQAVERVAERAVSKEDVSKLEKAIADASAERVSASSTTSSELKTALDALVAENKALAEKNAELVASQNAMAARLTSLPESFNSSIVNLQNGIAELIVSRDVPKKDLDDLKKLNSEYQVQLTKARAQHGQVRVEKDLLGEKLVGVESERDSLRAKVAELEQSKKEEIKAIEARKTELDEALANALGRLQASDIVTQTHQQKIAELEKIVKEASAEKAALKAKADSLEIRATVAEREKEAATSMLGTVRQEQSQWALLHQATEKIDTLTKLFGEVDSDELKDLRRYHDRTKNLESDHAALQKRFRDLETKMANSEKVTATAKASLSQAQQRSSEWEKTAKQYEGELELVKTKLDQAEQTHSQLDADYSSVRIQFEEQEADARLSKDRENRLREQVSALEAKVVLLQDELLKAKSGSRTTYRTATNGSATHPPPRPDSRSSVNTISGRRDRQISSYSPNTADSPPQPSVLDSIHAPTNSNSTSRYPSGVSASIHAPKSRYPNHLGLNSTPRTPVRKSGYPAAAYRASAPSPTPSTVSAAPTQGADGWWE